MEPALQAYDFALAEFLIRSRVELARLALSRQPER